MKSCISETLYCFSPRLLRAVAILLVAIPQIARAQLGERESLILKRVMAVGGSIDQKTHEEFWSILRGEKVDPKVVSFVLECVTLAQSYQVEAWKAVRISYRTGVATVTAEVTDAENQYVTTGYNGGPWKKGTPEYNSFFASFYPAFKASKQRTREIIAAAASHGSIKTFQGITVQVDEPYIDAIIAEMDQSFARLRKLANPVWEDAGK